MDFSLSEMNRLYTEADQCDKDTFSEMRSNILLCAGNHYSKRSRSEVEARILDSRQLTQNQKVRLTMNHIQKAARMSEDFILEQAPGVKCFPQNERETQDVKSAELHNSVLSDIKRQVNFDMETTSDVQDFYQIGEVATKIFFDPSMGVPIDVKQTGIDPMTGGPTVTNVRTFSGKIVFERVYGFNLLRPRGCTDLQLAPWLMIRKMMPLSELKYKLKDVLADKKNSGLLNKLQNRSSQTTFVVFDAHSGDYRTSKDEVLIKELYLRPCAEYPHGYFVIWVDEAILWEGELPGGIFPVVCQTYLQMPTIPRGVSQIRHGRPYQMEMNRCASKIAEHQITLGDDKLVTFNNSKVTKGADLPGVRHLSVGGSGQTPVVITGRTGDQYMGYYQQKEAEFYRVMMLEEEAEQKGQNDPLALLLKRARQKKRFSKFATKFECFQVQKYQTALEIYRYSVPETAVIPVIGKQEQVNISEFKNMKPSEYQIKVEATSADIDGQYAKQLALSQILQYAGQQISRDDLGKILRAMPFLNKETIFSDMTLQFDTAQNVILALDRGQMPPISEGEDPVYMIQRLTNRMTLSDFQFMPQQVQTNYRSRLIEHQKMMAERTMEAARLKAGLIPTTGPLIGVDFYVTDETNQTRTRRARVPMDAVRYLIDALQKQGMTVEQLDALPGASQAAVSQMLNPQMQGGMNGPEQPVPGNQQQQQPGGSPGQQPGFNGAVDGRGDSGVVPQ